MIQIPLSTLDKTPYFQASKWLTVSLLCDAQELDQLLGELGEIYIVSIGGINQEGEESVSKEKFLKDYQNYVEILKAGEQPIRSNLQSAFTKAFSLKLDHFCKIPVSESTNLVRIMKPVIQLQPHFFIYSQTDGKFHTKVFSADSISWGIQFSYPQLFQEAETKDVKSALLEETFPNGIVYKKLQQWMRKNSTVTPFLVEGKKVNVPLRLGKRCFSWINRHLGLRNKSIEVIV